MTETGQKVTEIGQNVNRMMIDLTQIVYAMSIASFIANIIFILRYYKVFKFADKAIKQWATMMNQRKREVNNAIQLTEAQQGARTKLAGNIRKKVPMGVLDNFTDNEIIALMADKDVMRGTFIIADTAGKALGTLSDFFGKLFTKEPSKPEEPGQQQVIWEVK